MRCVRGDAVVAGGAGGGAERGKAVEEEEARKFREFADDEVATGVDPELREHLRAWRSKKAKELAMPAYIVMNDNSLDADNSALGDDHAALFHRRF